MVPSSFDDLDELNDLDDTNTTLQKQCNNCVTKNDSTVPMPEEYLWIDPYEEILHNIAIVTNKFSSIITTLEKMQSETSLNKYINHKNQYGETPLHCAMRYQNWNAIKALIQFGADLEIENHEGETITTIAKKLDSENSLISLDDLIHEQSYNTHTDLLQNTIKEGLALKSNIALK